MPDPTNETLRFRDYVRPVADRLWLIALIVAAATTFAYAYSNSRPDRFRASTTMLLSIDTTSIDSTSILSDRSIGNQVELIKSREVSTVVARRLGRPQDASTLANSISATSQSGRDFLVISAERSTGADAAALANAYALAFIDLRKSAQRTRTTKLLDQSRKQLAALPKGQASSSQRAQLEASIQQYELTLSASTGAAQQINPAVAPRHPFTPRPKRDAAVALFVSLVGAIALAYALHTFDRRLKRIEDIGDRFALPILSLLPKNEEPLPIVDGRATIAEPFKEPLRQLRSNLQLTCETLPPRLLVTSATAGEGKSTLATSLAISLRESGLRVALVDADLRKPRLATLLAPDAEIGLTDVLVGTHALEDAVRLVPVEARGLQTVARIGATASVHAAVQTADGAAADTREEITLLTAGKHLADPTTVLASPRTRAVIDALVETHDVVIIDSAPLLNVADSAALASLADAVLLVARLGQVTQDSAARLRETLTRIPDVNPLGVIVNDVSLGEGYGYGYGYGYTYGTTATT